MIQGLGISDIQRQASAGVALATACFSSSLAQFTSAQEALEQESTPPVVEDVNNANRATPEEIAELIADLHSGNPADVYLAANELTRIKPEDARSAYVELVKIAYYPNLAIRREVNRALTHLEKPEASAEVVAQLFSLINRDHLPLVRVAACNALKAISNDYNRNELARAYTRALIEEKHKPREENEDIGSRLIRAQIVEALGSIGSDGLVATNFVIEDIIDQYKIMDAMEHDDLLYRQRYNSCEKLVTASSNCIIKQGVKALPILRSALEPFYDPGQLSGVKYYSNYEIARIISKILKSEDKDSNILSDERFDEQYELLFSDSFCQQLCALQVFTYWKPNLTEEQLERIVNAKSRIVVLKSDEEYKRLVDGFFRLLSPTTEDS